MENQVGWLVNAKHVLCLKCFGFVGEPRRAGEAPLYLSNLLPYRQSCHNCNKPMSTGMTLAWPELYEGEPLTQKQHAKLVWAVMLYLEAAKGEADYAEVVEDMRADVHQSGDGPFKPTAQQIHRAINDVVMGHVPYIIKSLVEVFDA